MLVNALVGEGDSLFWRDFRGPARRLFPFELAACALRQLVGAPLFLHHFARLRSRSQACVAFVEFIATRPTYAKAAAFSFGRADYGQSRATGAIAGAPQSTGSVR